MGEYLVFLPRTGDDSFYEKCELLQRERKFQLGKGIFQKHCKFGESHVASITLDDRRRLDEVTGGDPFGADVRIQEKNGPKQNYIVVDYFGNSITLIRVKTPIREKYRENSN